MPLEATRGIAASVQNSILLHFLILQNLLNRYGQEEPGERLEILQQPLALGYLTSTAPTGNNHQGAKGIRQLSIN